MADKSVSPWAVVVIRLLRSGRLLNVANQSSLPYSESYLRPSENVAWRLVPFGPRDLFISYLVSVLRQNVTGLRAPALQIPMVSGKYDIQYDEKNILTRLFLVESPKR